MTYDPRLMKLCDALSNNCIEWKHMEKNEPYLHYAKAERYLQPLLDAAPQSAEAPFEVGQPVTKPKGYRFNGVVKAIWWEDEASDWRLVVKNGDGLMHIFNPSQLAPAMAKPEEAQIRPLLDLNPWNVEVFQASPMQCHMHHEKLREAYITQAALLDTLAGALEVEQEWWRRELEMVVVDSDGWPDGYSVVCTAHIEDLEAALSRFKAYKEGV